MNIQWIGAHPNNYLKGRKGKSIKKIVMHWIVGTLNSADVTFNKPDRIASAHYGIGGVNIHQYVQEEDTAYHAGNFQVNLESIGIEHEGGPDIPISEETYKTSAELIKKIAKTYQIPLDRDHIILHREIKPTQCPGDLNVDRIIVLAQEEEMEQVLSKEKTVAFYRDQTGLRREPENEEVTNNRKPSELYRGALIEVWHRFDQMENQLGNKIDALEKKVTILGPELVTIKEQSDQLREKLQDSENQLNQVIEQKNLEIDSLNKKIKELSDKQPEVDGVVFNILGLEIVVKKKNKESHD